MAREKVGGPTRRRLEEVLLDKRENHWPWRKQSMWRAPRDNKTESP